MTQAETVSQKHLRYCAARNSKTALGFVLFSALEAFLFGRQINKPLLRVDNPIMFSFGELYAVTLMVILIQTLRCWRERTVLSIATAVCMLALGKMWFIQQMAPAAYLIQRLKFFAWCLSLLISTSLLVSALTNPPIQPKTRK